MRDSDFWKKLERKFRSVEDCARVHFNWTDVPGSANLEMWDCALPGTALLTARLRFEGFARRAGTKIDPQCMDSLAAWLSLLKRKGRRDLVKYGSEPGRGQIQCVCAVSADYCLFLENQAVEAERIARYEKELESQSNIRNVPGESPAQKREESSQSDCRNKRIEQVVAFLAACNRKSAKRIYKRHIWLSVGHTKGRQFEYWQACKSAATAADDRNFSRILGMKPEEFVTLLRQKHLLE
jgi:hypothetical protein